MGKLLKIKKSRKLLEAIGGKLLEILFLMKLGLTISMDFAQNLGQESVAS